MSAENRFASSSSAPSEEEEDLDLNSEADGVKDPIEISRAVTLSAAATATATDGGDEGRVFQAIKESSGNGTIIGMSHSMEVAASSQYQDNPGKALTQHLELKSSTTEQHQCLCVTLDHAPPIESYLKDQIQAEGQHYLPSPSLTTDTVPETSHQLPQVVTSTVDQTQSQLLPCPAENAETASNQVDINDPVPGSRQLGFFPSHTQTTQLGATEGSSDCTQIAALFGPLGEVNSSEVQHSECHYSQAEEQKLEVRETQIHRRVETITTYRDKGVVGREARDNVAEIYTTDDNHTPIKKPLSSEAEVLCQSMESFPNKDFGCKEDTSMVDLKEGRFSQVCEPANDQIKEILSVETDSVIVDISVGPSACTNACFGMQVPKAHAFEDEKHKGGIEVVEVEHVMVIDELSSGQKSEIVGMKNGVAETDASDCKSSYADDNQILEVEVVEGGSASPAKGQLNYKEETHAEHEHQKIIVQSADTGLEEVPGNKNEELSRVLFAPDPKPVIQVLDGSPTADVCVSQCGGIETILVRDGNINPDPEFPLTEECNASLLEVQNTDTRESWISPTEKNKNAIDVGGETDIAGRLSVLAENQIITSHGSEARVSQISEDEQTKRSVLEDVDNFSCSRGKLETGDQLVEDISPVEESTKTKDMRDFSGSSLFEDIYEKSSDSVREVYPERMQLGPNTETVPGFDQLKTIAKQVLCEDTLNSDISCSRSKLACGNELVEDISLVEESTKTKEMGDVSECSLLEDLYEKSPDSIREVYPERMQLGPNAEPVPGFDQPKAQVLCQDTLKIDISSGREHVASYTLTPERDGEFLVSDLVWGKVRSHPWWPGQIFDASDASERAMKYKRKGRFLVAYFGDQTFAWNEAQSLRHFRTHFSQMEKQSNSEAFRIAVNYALDEVCRRVELGMVCACTPKEVYASVNFQVIENAGIRKEARRMDRLGNSPRVTLFESGKLLQFIQSLASHPCGEVDRLELKIAQAQLLAFYRLKGYCHLPEFHIYRGLLEDDFDSLYPDKQNHSHEVIKHETPVPHNGEQILYDNAKLKTLRSSQKRDYGSGGLHPSRKKKRLSDLMSGKKGSSPLVSGRNALKERASSKSVSSSKVKRKVVNAMKGQPSLLRNVSDSSTPQSFKVGECIRRIASQLTGSPPILKCSRDKLQNGEAKLGKGSAGENDGINSSSCMSEGTHQSKIALPVENSLDEMLSQLCLAAQDPKKEYHFLTTLIGFFSEFRNSISLKAGIGIKKPNIAINFSGTFDFEEKSDSYWTDRIIQSSSEEQPSCRSRTKKEGSHFRIPAELDTSPFQVEDPLQLSLVLDFEEQNLDDEHVLVNEKPSRKYRKRKRKSQPVLSVDEKTASDHANEFSPTTLSMSFTESDSIPSLQDLNKIFRRFGPLKESETEVLRDTKSATVVFKKQTDAEVALSSAAKFSIFGPVHVNYQLRY